MYDFFNGKPEDALLKRENLIPKKTNRERRNIMYCYVSLYFHEDLSSLPILKEGTFAGNSRIVVTFISQNFQNHYTNSRKFIPRKKFKIANSKHFFKSIFK